MAWLDRVRDAARPDNRIAAAPSQVAKPQSASPASPTAAQSAGNTGLGGQGAAYATEPVSITRSYYVEERGGIRRFYDDYQRKNLAMRADAAVISSRREDLNTIRAMLTLAEARGWSELKVTGSSAFRREAWIEAQARGLSAHGHKASDLDRQEADRRRGERGPVKAPPSAVAATNTVEPAASSAPPAQAVQPMPVSPVPSASVAAQSAGAVRTAAALAGSAPARDRAKSGKPAAIQVESGRGRVPGNAEPSPAVAQPASAAEHRKAIRDAVGELSPDGKLILAALAEKIDRQMSKLSADVKLETKAFAASELLNKERRDGPVVLPPELRIVATAPAPARQPEPATAAAPPPRNAEPEPARRSLSR